MIVIYSANKTRLISNSIIVFLWILYCTALVRIKLDSFVRRDVNEAVKHGDSVVNPNLNGFLYSVFPV